MIFINRSAARRADVLACLWFAMAAFAGVVTLGAYWNLQAMGTLVAPAAWAGFIFLVIGLAFSRGARVWHVASVVAGLEFVIFATAFPDKSTEALLVVGTRGLVVVTACWLATRLFQAILHELGSARGAILLCAFLAAGLGGTITGVIWYRYSGDSRVLFCTIGGLLLSLLIAGAYICTAQRPHSAG